MIAIIFPASQHVGPGDEYLVREVASLPHPPRLAAICSKIGRIPTQAEYLADVRALAPSSDTIYQYLNFDQIAEYSDVAEGVGS